MLNQTYELYNGIKIPKIGLGTWLIDNKDVYQVIKNAVKIGYKHIDTAQAYGNEAGIGKALKEITIPRNELFITTKIQAELKNHEDAKKSIDESLNKLGLDYIDLFIIHCPQPWNEKRYFKENIQVWKALEEAYKTGKVKAIGVSNFLIDDLQNILDNCEIKPMVNQVEAHICDVPFELAKFCKENDILIEAYSPIAHGLALQSEKIKEIADKYNVTVAQLCIRYTLELGFVTLPKTVHKEYMKLNANVDFQICEEDMKILNSMKSII